VPEPGNGYTTAVKANRLGPYRHRGWLFPVEHIGSRAVEGLPAKPIMDMLALVWNSDAFESATPGMVARA